MTELFLVAPYASVLAGLRVLLSPFSDLSVIGEARDVSTLLYLFGTQRPDALIYDGSSAGLAELVEAAATVDAAIVALCDDVDDIPVIAQRRPGSWAALKRSAGGEELAAGIRAAVGGLIALDPAFGESLRIAVADDVQAVDTTYSDPILTPREIQVLQLMTHGLPNKNIAARLNVSLSTAKFHVASILAKLDASSRTEAVTIGARRGLISL